jgi:tetratricopeptide (TPR) repeat protein
MAGSALLFSQRTRPAKPKPAARLVMAKEEQLWQLRNIGKAFYENPTTQVEAVGKFAEALKLNPTSVRERLNYALSLMRANRSAEGVAELKKVQTQAPNLPHTYFNLGIHLKREGESELAVQQLEKMAELDPKEPVTRYNLGVLYKTLGQMEKAVSAFELANQLNPALAGPYFQLYNAYRSVGRAAEAKKALETFQAIRKFQEDRGDAVPKEDMEWSDYAEIYDPIDFTRADKMERAPLRFMTAKIAEGIDSDSACISALQNGPGRPWFVVWSKSGVLLFNERGEPQSTGLPTKGVVSATVFDANNDSFQDLAVVTQDEVALWMNEKGKFSRAKTIANGSFVKVLATDYDHDYDLDLILLGKSSKLFRNEAEAGFNERSEAFPFVAGDPVDGVVFKSVSDTKGIDVLVTYRDRTSVLYRDKLTAVFQANDLPLVDQAATNLLVRDLDQNATLDLLFLSDGKLKWVANQRTGFAAGSGFASSDINLSNSSFQVGDLHRSGTEDLLFHNTLSDSKGNPLAQLPFSAKHWLTEDFNQDGLSDLVGVQADGTLHIATNQTVTSNRWTRIEMTGIKNLVTAPYAEVEIKSGPTYQKRVFTGVPITFGLRGRQTIDTVRITWPNALIQNEMNQASNKALVYKEAQRLSGSCPMIFTWNGQGFTFITDVLGVAPLGAMSGDGEFFPTDHDEYVSIPGEKLLPKNGRYQLRITEELGEVSYLDQLKLIAVDHPADVEIFSNEKWKSPPYPEFRLFGVKRRIYPKSAIDHRNVDLLDRVLRKDQRYADGFARTMANTAETHYLELDFGTAAPDGKAVMVLNGWVDWADGSTFMNRAQGKREPITPPYLQMQNGQGEWVTTIDDFGMPSGKTKTQAIDLSGKWLSSSRKVRIVTNMCVFWDEIFLGEDPSQPNVTLTTMPLAKADVQFHGFSKSTVHPERKLPEHFEYSPTTFLSNWNPTRGNYTRFGDVAGLVNQVDDRLAIIGSGDEVVLEFEAIATKPNLKRDFLLLVDGWAKDSDANTAFGQQVDPLPFHGMTQYPYHGKETYPSRPELQEWIRKYNTRPGLRMLRPLK